MTKQDKIDYSSPVAQNLYLLVLNDEYQKALKAIKKKHKAELSDIKKLKKSSDLATHGFGSKELKDDIEYVIKNCPLYRRPEVHVLRAMTVFLLTDVNINLLLNEVNKNIYVRSLIPPPWTDIDIGDDGTAIVISASNYHLKEDVINAINKIWPKIEAEQAKYRSEKVKMSKFQPFSVFEDKISILKDRENHLTHREIGKKYKLGSGEASKVIIRQLKKRIKALYNSPRG